MRCIQKKHVFFCILMENVPISMKFLGNDYAALINDVCRNAYDNDKSRQFV